MSDILFSIETLLSQDVYPHEFRFKDGPLQGYTIWYRSIPTDASAVIESAIGDKLTALGFKNTKAAIQELYTLKSSPADTVLTGKEYEEHEDAMDRLTAETRHELMGVLTEGMQAVAVRVVGKWSATAPIEKFGEVLAKFPEVTKAVYELAGGVTLSTDKQALLKK